MARRRSAGRPATLTKTIGDLRVTSDRSCSAKEETRHYKFKISAAPPLHGEVSKTCKKQRHEGRQSQTARRPIRTAARRPTSQRHEGRQTEKGWIYLAHARRRFGDDRGVSGTGTRRRRPRHLLLPSTSASSPSPPLPFSSSFLSSSSFFLFLLFFPSPSSSFSFSFFLLFFLPSSSFFSSLLLLTAASSSFFQADGKTRGARGRAGPARAGEDGHARRRWQHASTVAAGRADGGGQR